MPRVAISCPERKKFDDQADHRGVQRAHDRAGATQAQDIKIGLNLPYTDIGTELAQQIDRGTELSLKPNADKVKPHRII